MSGITGKWDTKCKVFDIKLNSFTDLLHTIRGTYLKIRGGDTNDYVNNIMSIIVREDEANHEADMSGLEGKDYAGQLKHFTSRYNHLIVNIIMLLKVITFNTILL